MITQPGVVPKCIQCVFHRQNEGAWYSCKNPVLITKWGNNIKCAQMRMNNDPWACGEQGRFWEKITYNLKYSRRGSEIPDEMDK